MSRRRFSLPLIIGPALGAALALSACERPAPANPPASTAPAAAQPVLLSQSIDAIMVAVIDFAADGIWRPAASETPLTDAQWLLVQQDAVAISAAATLITLPGTGINDAAWVKAEDWRRWATEMRELGDEARIAAQTKDQAQLALVGDRLIEVCQACHNTYKPGLPTMGVTRFPLYPKRELVAASDPAQPGDPSLLFRIADTNRDGQLDRGEWLASMPDAELAAAAAIWTRLDPGGTGHVTLEQFNAFNGRPGGPGRPGEN